MPGPNSEPLARRAILVLRRLFQQRFRVERGIPPEASLGCSPAEFVAWARQTTLLPLNDPDAEAFEKVVHLLNYERAVEHLSPCWLFLTMPDRAMSPVGIDRVTLTLTIEFADGVISQSLNHLDRHVLPGAPERVPEMDLAAALPAMAKQLTAPYLSRSFGETYGVCCQIPGGYRLPSGDDGMTVLQKIVEDGIARMGLSPESQRVLQNWWDLLRSYVRPAVPSADAAPVAAKEQSTVSGGFDVPRSSHVDG